MPHGIEGSKGRQSCISAWQCTIQAQTCTIVGVAVAQPSANLQSTGVVASGGAHLRRYRVTKVVYGEREPRAPECSTPLHAPLQTACAAQFSPPYSTAKQRYKRFYNHTSGRSLRPARNVHVPYRRVGCPTALKAPKEDRAVSRHGNAQFKPKLVRLLV